MKDRPKTQADFPASRSSLLYKPFPKTVDERAMANGGTIPEIMTAAMTVLVSPTARLVNDATPKKYAAFRSDPPNRLPSCLQAVDPITTNSFLTSCLANW